MAKKKNKNVLMNFAGVNFYLSDANHEHFQTLTIDQQEAVKQMMIFKMLQDKYD
jgi:hypothetical protein